MEDKREHSGRHIRELRGNHPYFQKLWLFNPLFGELCIILVTPDFYKKYTYSLSYIIYLEEPSGNIISNYHGTFIHIFTHIYYI